MLICRMFLSAILIVMLKKTCTFKNADKTKNFRSCKNAIYENHLCKIHFSGPDFKNGKVGLALSIYIGGLEKTEQDLYEDITVGNLKHEIKLAKLQLRRLFTGQYEYDRMPEDIKNMKIGSITLKDVMVREGQIVTTSGIPIDLITAAVQDALKSSDVDRKLIPASSIESSMNLSRPDFEGNIEKMLAIIMKLEKTHYELMGGSSDDPNHLAKQIMDALNAIEDDAQGKDYVVN